MQRGWQGQGFHDTSSLEFTVECPTASAWYNARAVSQILRDLPAVEGKPARHTSTQRGDKISGLLVNEQTNASQNSLHTLGWREQVQLPGCPKGACTIPGSL